MSLARKNNSKINWNSKNMYNWLKYLGDILDKVKIYHLQPKKILSQIDLDFFEGQYLSLANCDIRLVMSWGDTYTIYSLFLYLSCPLYRSKLLMFLEIYYSDFKKRMFCNRFLIYLIFEIIKMLLLAICHKQPFL